MLPVSLKLFVCLKYSTEHHAEPEQVTQTQSFSEVITELKVTKCAPL